MVTPKEAGVVKILMNPGFDATTYNPRLSHPCSNQMKVACLLAFTVLLPDSSHGALYDEIQVYTDDINAPGHPGIELHINTNPEGRKTPDYPGESTPDHGWRATAEFSYGLPHSFEAGLYLPTILDAAGRFDLAGFKLRLKWMPIHPEEGKAGWYFGANTEFGRVRHTFEESKWGEELRLIGGYHTPEWLIGANVVPSWPLSSGYRHVAPNLEIDVKASHKILEGISAGIEYYGDLGPTWHLPPINQQAYTLYLAIDVDRKPWVFNFGVGRGLTPGADAWTVKAIIEVPF